MKKELYLYAGGALLVVGLLVYLIKTFNGKAIGTQAAGLVTGLVGGVATSVAAVANDPTINPLYDAGSSLGGTIYDWFH